MIAKSSSCLLLTPQNPRCFGPIIPYCIAKQYPKHLKNFQDKGMFIQTIKCVDCELILSMLCKTRPFRDAAPKYRSYSSLGSGFRFPRERLSYC